MCSMNILILSNKLPYPPNDGGAIATLNMLLELDKQGNKVEILTMQTPKHFFNEDLPDIFNNIVWHQVFVNTKIKRFEALWNLFFSKKPYNAKRFESKEYAKKLLAILQQKTFDIVQLEGLYLTSYIKIIRQYSSAKISLRNHNVEWKIWQGMSKNETNFLKKNYYKLLARRIKKMEYKALKNIDLLVPITEKDKEELPFISSENTFVSQTGIIPERLKEVSNQGAISFFYLGSLDWLPNQEGLLWFLENVWTELKQDFPNFNFTIAGRNASDGFVKKIKKYPVYFKGEVSSATDFIDQNSVMIVPLFAGSGMRIKIIEAMARSKCVVTTTIGAEGIDVKNMENIVIANDADEMIEAMEWLIEEPERVRRISENAYRLIAKKYNNNLLVKQLCEFYQQKLN